MNKYKIGVKENKQIKEIIIFADNYYSGTGGYVFYKDTKTKVKGFLGFFTTDTNREVIATFSCGIEYVIKTD